MIGEVKARFSKVAPLKPGGFFIHYDLHKVQSLEVSLVQMGALSLNQWLTKFIQEVAKLLKEKYLAKTMLRTKYAVVFLYVALAVIYFDTLIVLHLILAVNKLALKCIVS